MTQPQKPWYRARTTDALGIAVQGARQDAGLNQDQLALLTNTSRPTISRLERGKPATTTTVVEVLAACGYELVVVPRGAQVRVEEPP